VAYTQERRTLTESELQHLYSVATIQKQRIESVRKSQQQRFDLVVHRIYLRRLFAQFLQDPRPEYQEQMRQILRDAQASNADFRTIALFATGWCFTYVDIYLQPLHMVEYSALSATALKHHRL